MKAGSSARILHVQAHRYRWPNAPGVRLNPYICVFAAPLPLTGVSLRRSIRLRRPANSSLRFAASALRRSAVAPVPASCWRSVRPYRTPLTCCADSAAVRTASLTGRRSGSNRWRTAADPRQHGHTEPFRISPGRWDARPRCSSATRLHTTSLTPKNCSVCGSHSRIRRRGCAFSISSGPSNPPPMRSAATTERPFPGILHPIVWRLWQGPAHRLPEPA